MYRNAERRGAGVVLFVISAAVATLGAVAPASAAPRGTTAAAGAAAAAMPTPAPYMPIVPIRICDTRPVLAGKVDANQCNHNGTGSGTMSPASTMTVVVAGGDGVPATATAVALNVTVADATGVSFLTVWPAGATQPTASDLNWGPGDTIPNLVQVQVGTGGAVSVFNNQATADVIIDLEGYYDASAPDFFQAVTPSRVCDTRALSTDHPANQCQAAGGAAGTLHPNTSKTVTIGGSGGVPSGATAVVLNVTVVGPGAVGFYTVWPHGNTQPLASNLNWAVNQTVPNRVVVALGSGQVDVFLGSAAAADLVIDVNGYFTTSNTGDEYVPQVPDRICDTRPVAPPGVIANVCNDPAHGGPMALQPGDEVVLGTQSTTAFVAVFNVTVTDTTGDSFLTVFPDPDPSVFVPPPLASDLNWTPGQVKANLVVVQAGTSATAFYNNLGTTNLVVDLEGVYVHIPAATAVAAATPAVTARVSHPPAAPAP